ncbi:MAG: hypothetical protein M1840_000824 [Geoglossum simile]|nr:MAG: hypothetical protein M1840_000824 [Geoglossum simile]
MYKVIELFDRNIVTTEGDLWMRHRKSSARGFGDKVYRSAWREGLGGGRSLLDSWLRNGGRMEKLESDAMGLSLSVMWRGAFGMKRRAAGAFVEFERYMKELIWGKRNLIAKGGDEEQVGVLGPTIRGVYGIPNVSNDDKPTPAPPAGVLTESELMADAFMFLFAGHETSATTIYFSLLFLALNPPVQQDLQSSLDTLLSNRPIEEWDYDHDLPALLTGLAGAVMNEALRLMPPFMYVPKITPIGEGPQGLVLDGKRVIVPEGCQVSIVLPAAHRNPNHWPTEEGVEDDLDTFKPRRWFIPSEDGNDKPTELFRPPRGAFAPFSDGPRSCIGRRFAQTEIVAVLAAIFLTHSIELSVSAFASDAAVERMPLGGAERKEIWQKAAANAEERLALGIENSSIGTITRDDARGIQFRAVARGEERFRGFS